MAVVVDILYDNTIENSQTNSNKIKHPCPNCCCSLEFVIGFVFALYLVTFVLGFLIGDLYFANSYISCQDYQVPIGYSFTLTDWLEVSGYSCFVLVFLFAKWFYIFIRNFEPDNFIIGIGIIYSIFSFVWLIIGCVGYWYYIKPTNLCGPIINKYIEVRLWFGLTSMIILVVYCFGSWIYFKCTKLV